MTTPGTPAHVKLWDAINAFTVASGGRADATGGDRMDSVSAIERAIEERAIEMALDVTRKPPPGCRRCTECVGQEHHWIALPEHDMTRDVVFFECKHCPATCEAVEGDEPYEPSGVVADPPFVAAGDDDGDEEDFTPLDEDGDPLGPEGDTIEQKMHAHVSAWLKRTAPRLKIEGLDYATIKLTILQPSSEEDGTLYLDYRLEEESHFESDGSGGRVPGVRL